MRIVAPVAYGGVALRVRPSLSPLSPFLVFSPLSSPLVFLSSRLFWQSRTRVLVVLVVGKTKGRSEVRGEREGGADAIFECMGGVWKFVVSGTGGI